MEERDVELGRAPKADEAASRAGRLGEEVGEGWRRLHDGRALVLDDGGAASPFSAVRSEQNQVILGDVGLAGEAGGCPR